MIANGLGGYSSSTIIGTNTRKYHGLLVAPTDSPWNRKLFLSKVEEKISIDDEEFQLSTNQYPGVIHPQGYKHLQKFKLDPFPILTYSIPSLTLKKTIYMPHGKNAVVVNYRISKNSKGQGKIQVNPLVNSRGIDEIRRKEESGSEFGQNTNTKQTEIFYSPAKTPFLLMGSDTMKYEESSRSEEDRWFRNMEYQREKERGFDFREDQYNPGSFELKLKNGLNNFNFLAAAGSDAERDYESLYPKNSKKIEETYNQSVKRLENLTQNLKSVLKLNRDYTQSLAQAADSFIVNNEAIIAGYHWFTTWGRDALIALPGLTLVTDRHKIARNVLLALGKQEKNGMIPNRFGGKWTELNSVDASLLFFYALQKYLSYTEDLETLEKLWKTLERILDRYISGIEGKVQIDNDGLIWSGPGLTWMDARIDGTCITPREGKAVEINALWYNALKIRNILAKKIDREPKWIGEINRIEKNFQEKFWNPEKECLYDVISNESVDDSIRPNQLLAISLPFQLLDEEKSRSVVSAVENELLTPYGLRSLDVNDANYKGSYKGNIKEKDSAYHQGTVWTWLMGPFITAKAKFQNETGEKEKMSNILEALLNKHLKEAGLGTISEIFDGNEPHHPRGCISQAWSVGELLRCYAEDVMGRRPPYEDDFL